MKFLSKFMMLFLLSSCSYLNNQPEDYTAHMFPSTWRGYYKFKSTDDTSLNYLTEEFKVSKDYMTLKNSNSSSSTGYYEDDKFTSYQVDWVYKSTDNLFCFTVYPAYESQDFIEGYFTFVPSGDDVKVTYYYATYGTRSESATYEKRDTPF